MTNEETVKIVDKVCSAWNQMLTMASKKDMYVTWFHLLKDIDFLDANSVVDDLIVEDERFMPRVGTVRRRVLAKKFGAPPEPIIAWQQMRVAADQIGSGVGSFEFHELVRVTIAKLGGTGALAMHTNGDREAFFTVYKSVVSEWERKNYGITGG
jgi:hypothetical protein